jgi:hypothetical protein
MTYQPPPYNPPGFPVAVAPAIARGPQRFSIFGAMFRSLFFNGDVSRDVARNWGGIGFWYLFLLELITWIAVLIKVHIGFAAFVRNDLPALVNEVPPITISKGHVTSPVEQPYYLRDPKTKKTFAVLDTTGVVNSLDDTDAQLLITDHKVWSRDTSNPSEIKQYDLSKIQYFYVDKARLTGWMHTASHFLAIGLLPIVLVGTMIGRLIQALIYGGLNMAFSAGFNARLSYGAAMRLAVVSVTPVILLDTVFELTGVKIPFWALIGIAIALLYMVMAVKANRVANAPPVLG